ncbi:anti-sigma factor [Acanthopleuribacter pedis]|uniref:Anti-sigma factor n=1 Tax=Acanthopleuribacter pedis TaxID=442870 RepID=A0A8J7U396_9BACT|nr:anti-sigma factor [Acanthopleuribacter pedis]MBO1317233.1 anti-sigma factor [Acanthopleuribacter pedis]MBO1318539.1 anti-sigma factor [Acanthopleuribacter pedis]
MNNERLLDILVDRETGDLDRKDRIALAGLELDAYAELEDEIGLAVAAAMLAHEESEEEKLPAELHIHIAEDAKMFFAEKNQKGASPKDEADNGVVTPFPAKETEASSSAGIMTNIIGWLVAAALAAFALLPREPSADQIAEIRTATIAEMRPALEQELRASIEAANRPPSPLEQRQQLLASTDATTLPWQATPDQTATGASGDVVWSGDAQEGYMRIQGLAANDPSTYQYQLWIFDEEGDERFPVDGGVFDMPAGDGEVIIPIDAKIGVKKPALYAITIEKPGGVVVSGRERIVLVAKPG